MENFIFILKYSQWQKSLLFFVVDPSDLSILDDLLIFGRSIQVVLKLAFETAVLYGNVAHCCICFTLN